MKKVFGILIICLIVMTACSKTNTNEIQSDDIYQKALINDFCFDPDLVDPTKQCGDDFTPVCACEAITFTSPCEAEKNGFTNYEFGKCGEAACINEEVRRLFYVTTLYCPITFKVCGCDGKEYDS